MSNPPGKDSVERNHGDRGYANPFLNFHKCKSTCWLIQITIDTNLFVVVCCLLLLSSALHAQEDYRKITVEKKGEVNFFTSQMIQDCMRKVITVNLHQTVKVSSTQDNVFQG